jgi:anti-sigma factor RsiW
MNHLKYEEWLLSDEPLTAEQKLDLQGHLATCEACSRLAAAWNQVEVRLKAAPMLRPQPGFAARWQTHLVEARQKKHRRQNLMILLFSVGGAAALLTILAILALPLLRSPLPLLVRTAYQVTHVVSLADTVFDTAGALSRTVLDIFPASLLVGIFTALCALCVLWIVAVHQLTSQRRVIE